MSNGITLDKGTIDIDEDKISLGKGSIHFKASLNGSTAGGTNDYNKLINRPSINGHIIEGDKIDLDYELQHELGTITEQDIDRMMYGGD